MTEEFEPPTYEEYKKATDFARFRYKYGLIFTILCWLCLLFLIYYMMTHVNELSINPLQYAVENQNLECHCTGVGNVDFYINSTDKWVREPEKQTFDTIKENISIDSLS